MKRLLVGLTLLLACCSAKAQGWDYWYRLNSAFLPLNGGTAASGVGPYSGTPVLGDFIYFNGTNWVSLNKPADGTYSVTFTAGIPSWTAGGGGAPTNATYILETANGTLTNSFALGSLGTGLIINTTTTGVPTIMSAQSCTNQFVRSYSASGQATCSSVLNGDISSTMIQAATDGGAVAAQSASPGTQQGSSGSKNFNLNGKGILELDAIGATATDNITSQNTTAAALGAQQWSPALKFCGAGWNNGGSASETDCARIYVQPQQANPTTIKLNFDTSIAGGAFSNAMNLTNAGTLAISGALNGTNDITNTANNAKFNASGQVSGTGGFNMNYQNAGSVLFTGNRLVTASCTSGTTCSTTTNMPAGSIILSVAMRITTTVTGPTSFTVGDTGSATRFCASSSTLTSGSTQVCSGGATLESSAGAIVVTETGGTFTAGVFEFEISYLLVTPPTS